MNYYGPFMARSSSDFGLLLLRFGLGMSMIVGHGWSKFSRLLGGDLSFGDPLGIGSEVSFILVVFAEFICSMLLICGWYTRWILIPLIIAMLVVLIVVHWPDPFSRQEKAILYLVGYFTIFLIGPGRYSLDYYREKPQ